MNYEQLAKVSGCSSRSIRRWVDAGKLHAPPFSEKDIDIAKSLTNAYKHQQAANLSSFSAPDTGGETVSISCRLEREDAEWLRSQPEGASYHLRQALRMYRNTQT
jgi:hypothetical protein